jgi:Fic family protein
MVENNKVSRYGSVMDLQSLTAKKQSLDTLRPLPPSLVKNLEAWFRVELTYTSNAIEGNTLSRRETAVVIEKGLTVGGKSLKEHLEATNHAHAVDYVTSLVGRRSRSVSEQEILRLHELVLVGIDDANAGRYRNVPVRIAGSTVVLPNPRKVPELMEDFCGWLRGRSGLHPVAFAGEAHYRLVTIHPFVDGNGRTARLLMNLLLLIRGYPPAIIPPRDRLAYLGALETAQLGGPRSAYDRLIAKAVDRSLDIYLQAAQGKPVGKPISGRGRSATRGLTLMKIGQLAKAVGETVPTIRHWTTLGLLVAAQTTEAGYQMYDDDAVDRCRRIQSLKARRLTLAEIRAALPNS